MSNGSRYGKQQLVQSLGQLCQQHLSDVFKKFHALCAKRLTDLAAQAESNRLQTLYFDTQRLLKKQGAEIELNSIESALDNLLLLGDNGSGSGAGSGQLVQDNPSPSIAPASRSRRRAGQNFKLLENEDLEVMIALDNFSSRVREQLRGELYELEGRFKSLLDDVALPNPLPLSPDALLEAFVGSLDGDLIAVEVQLELVKTFGQICFDKAYAQMLNLAIDQLEEAGCELIEERPEGAKSKPDLQSQSASQAHSETQPQPKTAEQSDTEQPSGTQQQSDLAAETSGVQEQQAAYSSEDANQEQDADHHEPLIANTRIQTELLARISSMLENAEAEALAGQAQAAANGDSVGAATSGQAAGGHPAAGSDAGAGWASGTSSVSLSGPSSSTASSRSSPSNHSSPNQSSSKPCFAKPQLFAEINKHLNDLISHSSELASNGQITRDLAAAIKQLGKGKNGSRLHRNDASVFQVVENIFASFGQSMVVAPEVQQVINRCEIPMLKLALKKPLILEQENHPIRRLFNEMAKYAIGLEQGDCEDNKIYQQMLKLSENMLAESFDEHSLPQMLSEFMSLVDRDRRVTAQSEEQEVERVAAQEKLNWARTRVEEEIGKRMLGKKHPEAVIDFVQRSWCVVLHMAHQRNGEAGADWQVGLKLLDNLLYLSSRPVSDKDLKYRRELIKHIDARLGHISTDIAQRSLQIEQLREALGIPEQPSNQAGKSGQGAQLAKVTEIAPMAKKWARKFAAQTFSKTGKTLSQAEDKLVGEIKQVLMSALKTELPGKNIARAVNDAEAIDSVAERCLGALQKGCWIELGGDIKAHKRGKLAGIVGPSWKYVFVDNQGKLIAERDRARLAIDLLNGTVTVLDNSHLFDKAIKEAITQIKGLPVAS